MPTTVCPEVAPSRVSAYADSPGCLRVQTRPVGRCLLTEPPQIGGCRDRIRVRRGGREPAPVCPPHGSAPDHRRRRSQRSPIPSPQLTSAVVPEDVRPSVVSTVVSRHPPADCSPRSSVTDGRRTSAASADRVTDRRDGDLPTPPREREPLVAGEEPLRHDSGLGLWFVALAVRRLGEDLTLTRRPTGSDVVTITFSDRNSPET